MTAKHSSRGMRVLVVDDDYQLAHRLEEEDTRIQIELRSSRWLESAPDILGRGRFDLVIWHSGLEAKNGRADEREDRLIEHVRREYPNLSVMMITDSGAPIPPFALPTVALMPREENLWPRLLEATHRNGRCATKVQTPPASVDAPFPHIAAELRDPQSGRLDAARIAVLFGLRLTDVARLVGQKLPTLSRTPDAPSVQAGLALFERIVAALLPLAGSPERGRMWLNAPNPQFEGETPLKLLRNGDGDVVAQMLEDMLSGQSA